MKLVVAYSISGGYDCGCYDIVECHNYKSAEDWIVDFEEQLKASSGWFDFNGHNEYYAPNFKNNLPEVYELNEWFEKKSNQEI